MRRALDRNIVVASAGEDRKVLRAKRAVEADVVFPTAGDDGEIKRGRAFDQHCRRTIDRGLVEPADAIADAFLKRDGEGVAIIVANDLRSQAGPGRDGNVSRKQSTLF